jgi:hypothetical protein
MSLRKTKPLASVYSPVKPSVLAYVPDWSMTCP